VRSTSALSAQLFLLKLPELAPVRVFWHPGFAFVLVMHPAFFNIVAGSTFTGSFETGAIIKVPYFGNMEGGVKVLMDMTALTIITYDLIGLSRTKIALERLFNL
jgi:hypothetical protein